MDAKKIFNIKNRSASMVVYNIPEDNIRRQFAPGETKRIPYSELEKLTFQAGGREIMANFLQLESEAVTEALNIPREPEYDMDEKQIIELIKNGSLDSFLDALDFAPVGVIDLIKHFAVKVPMNDNAKREALKKKTGFDVTKALENEAADKAEEESEKTATAGRRVPVAKKAEAPVEETAPTRRTTANYKVVTPKA